MQIYYYRHKRSKTTDPTTGPSESTPLLISETAEVHTINEGKLPNALQSIIANRATQYVAAALFVVGFGFAAWMVDHSGHSEGPRNPLSKPNDTASVISQFLGWSSAILYSKSSFTQDILFYDNAYRFHSRSKNPSNQYVSESYSVAHDLKRLL